MTRRTSGTKIGARLSASRLRRGLSQGAVARRAGLAPSYLSRLETGKIEPRFATVMRVASVLKVPLQELADPVGPRTRGPCPLTREGHCMLDLIRSEIDVGAGSSGDAFTPRQIRLLRSLAAWLQRLPADRLKAVEVLVAALTEGLALKLDQ